MINYTHISQEIHLLLDTTGGRALVTFLHHLILLPLVPDLHQLLANTAGTGRALVSFPSLQKPLGILKEYQSIHGIKIRRRIIMTTGTKIKYNNLWHVKQHYGDDPFACWVYG